MNLLQRSFSPGQLPELGIEISFNLGHFRDGLKLGQPLFGLTERLVRNVVHIDMKTSVRCLKSNLLPNTPLPTVMFL